MKSFCFILVLIAPNFALFENEINYYEQLIKENIVKVQSYETPTFYNDFTIENEEIELIDYGTFDFIIAGGGTAGCLLAHRLSEINTWNILVIEAGGNENSFTDIPAMAGFTYSSDFNWGFKTTEQDTNCPVNKKPTIGLPRGKALGGSTVINGNLYSRGLPTDFDKWSAEGLKGWTFDEVLPFFKKFENATALKNINPILYGLIGPLTLENYKNTSDTSKAFIESVETYGYHVVDYNENVGVGYLQQSTDKGKRLSAAKAFLYPIQNRTNLKIQANSLVTKILLKEDIAVGVEFIFNNKKYVAKADIEVILSCGTYQSPQILMLSGIGPRKELSNHNITSKIDLPVGKNLKEQMVVSLTVLINETTPAVSFSSIIEQYLNGVGPLTTIGGVELLSIFNTNNSSTEILSGIVNDITIVNDSLKYGESSKTFSSYVVLLHPKSKGTVKLSSKNPLYFPLIDINYLADEEDAETFIDAVEFAAQLLTSASLKKEFNGYLIEDSSCGNFTFRSKSYWECIVRCKAGTASHPCGTCKMGIDDKDSVVNERLMVHGLQNLRVVDASVIPVTLTGHLFATVYMIAEKAADIIKEDHGFNY